MAKWSIVVSVRVDNKDGLIEVEARDVEVDGHGNLMLSKGTSPSDVVLIIHAGDWFSVQEVSSK